MNDSITIALGTPEHGWLPVDFHFKDFHLKFAASDVLNDPIEELYDAITQIKDNNIHRVVWWLEPAAYFLISKKADKGFP